MGDVHWCVSCGKPRRIVKLSRFRDTSYLVITLDCRHEDLRDERRRGWKPAYAGLAGIRIHEHNHK